MRTDWFKSQIPELRNVLHVCNSCLMPLAQN